jgi:hypothetical protein
VSGWRIYFRGLQPEELSATFYREGRLVDKRALRQMRRVSQMVMKKSISNTPVDWKGYTSKDPPGQELEKSHRIEEQYGESGRVEATVSVGGMVGDVNTDLYAMWIHDGFYELGKASKAKAAAGHEVGPEFLRRALDDYEAEFDGLLDELMRGLMS